jgi:hypothetical protein
MLYLRWRHTFADGNRRAVDNRRNVIIHRWDPVSGMTATVRALIERYQQYDVRNVAV